MRTIQFFEGNRSGNQLHIELPGCTINIDIGLTDRIGRAVTSVRISPDDESRGGDGRGFCWRRADATRIIRDLLPGLHGKPSATAEDCRFCQARIEQGDDHEWYDVTDAWRNGEPSPDRDDADRLACPKAPRRDSGLYPGLHEPAGPRYWDARQFGESAEDYADRVAGLISAARSWAADCEWAEGADDIADLTDAQIVAGIEARYDGGWAAFMQDGGYR